MRVVLINVNLFALVSTRILRLTPILFLIKVYRIVREKPLIKFNKSILLISNIYNSRKKTFLRGLLFLNPCL